MQTIRIQGFQSLRDVTLELGNFTTVEGDSRAGKSALVRALRVWAYNAKSVGAFVRHGEDAFTVTVDVDGHEVVCRRGEGVTEYVLDGETFEKIGFVVPEAVSDVTGFRAVRYDRDLVLPLQVQSQFDAPFLLGDQWTGPAITKVLGSVSRINVIYTAQRLARKRQRQTQRQIGEAEERVAGLVEQLAEYENVDAQAAAVAEAEDKLADAVNAGLRRDELAKAAEDHDAAKERLEALVEPTSRPEAAWSHARKIRSSLTDWSELLTLRDDLADARQQLAEIEVPTTNPVAAREKVELARAELSVLRELTELRDDEKAARERVESEVLALGAAKGSLATATQAKTDFFDEIETCPFCGQLTRGVVT